MAEVSRDRRPQGASRPGKLLAARWHAVASICRAGGLHGEMGCSPLSEGRTMGLPPSRQPQQLTSAYAELMRRGCCFFFFTQLGIQLAAVFMHKVPELAGVRIGPALPRSPKVLGEIAQFIFSGCRMPFPLHSSSLRYLITMFPIHMSGHFTCVRAP